MTSQERYSSVHAQLEHLQAKHVGTGHSDTTKLCAAHTIMLCPRDSHFIPRLRGASVCFPRCVLHALALLTRPHVYYAVRTASGPSTSTATRSPRTSRTTT